jgi:hypothetical protein
MLEKSMLFEIAYVEMQLPRKMNEIRDIINSFFIYYYIN